MTSVMQSRQQSRGSQALWVVIAAAWMLALYTRTSLAVDALFGGATALPPKFILGGVGLIVLSILVAALALWFTRRWSPIVALPVHLLLIWVIVAVL